MSLAIFQTWRSELAVELRDAEAKLTEALAALDAAEAARRDAEAERAQLAEAGQKMNGPGLPAIANALRSRLIGRDDELRQATAAHVTARQAVQNARARAGDLRDALWQLDVIDPPPAPVEESAELEAAA